MAFEIRTMAPAEHESWSQVGSRAFSYHPSEAERKLWRTVEEEDRFMAALDGDQMVGASMAYSLTMTVPGGRPMSTAVIEGVAVQPTHRRQGVLTQMAAHQLKDVHERGEPLAALHASESGIYGRFGYGMGMLAESWELAREHSSFARPHEQRGRLAFVEPDEAKQQFPQLFDRACADRPGVIKYGQGAWDSFLADLEQWRGGASAYFHVAYEEDGRALGYATYRTKEHTLTVEMLVAVTDEAYASLWRYCLDVDLMSTTKARSRPVDEPLPWMLADPRRLERSIGDRMWLRLVHVAAALERRSYMRDDRLVLEISDTFCTWNADRYELEGGPDGAECRLSTADPDLVLSVADLAAAYLGAVSLTTLSRAGRVEERTSGALRRADAMFATRLAPWCKFII